MIQVNTNMSAVIQAKLSKLSKLDAMQMCKEQAMAVLPLMRTRVHVRGQAADGGQIGTYSDGYMKVRTGSYGSSDMFKRGKSKGKAKNSGTVTRGSQKGSTRPKYSRSADTMVILSLTRQMENDLSVLPTLNGYGIGYNNEFNYNKSQWAEKTYKKGIWKLTNDERAVAMAVAEKYAKTVVE